MFIWLGVFLMILGIIFVLFGVISRLIPKLDQLPPILYVQKTLDGITIGTSPIIIIALIILYIILWSIKILR